MNYSQSKEQEKISENLNNKTEKAILNDIRKFVQLAIVLKL